MRKLTCGDRIKDRRKLLGLSAVDVADMLEINKASYYKYENNSTKKIPGDKLVKLAEILNCTPEFIIGYDIEEDEELKTLFMQLKPEDREKIKKQIKAMIKKYSYPFFVAAKAKKEAKEKLEKANIENAPTVDSVKDL